MYSHSRSLLPNVARHFLVLPHPTRSNLSPDHLPAPTPPWHKIKSTCHFRPPHSLLPHFDSSLFCMHGPICHLNFPCIRGFQTYMEYQCVNVMLAISGSGQYVFSRVLLGRLTTKANTAQVARGTRPQPRTARSCCMDATWHGLGLGAWGLELLCFLFLGLEFRVHGLTAGVVLPRRYHRAGLRGLTV